MLYIVAMKKICSLLILSCFAGVAMAWELEKDKDDIRLYSLQQPGHKLKHFKAETRIEKDADTILAALQDTAACAEWVYNCVSNKMVGMNDVSERIYHTIIHSPLWFKDRDFYLQSKVLYDPDKKLFTITLAAKPNHGKSNKGMVRVTQVAMIWRLQSLAEGVTAVSYQVYIDPKIPLKPINHSMIKKSVFQTMRGLKRVVEKPIYAETKYSESELEMLIEAH